MKRRHFKAIAEGLRNAKPRKEIINPELSAMEYSYRLYQWRLGVSVMADVCQSMNSEFNRDKFLKACEFSEE